MSDSMSDSHPDSEPPKPSHPGFERLKACIEDKTYCSGVASIPVDNSTLFYSYDGQKSWYVSEPLAINCCFY